MKNTTRVIAALFIGAAAGAALGILLAPEKGKKVREGIADFVNDLIDAAKKQAQSASGDLREFGNTAFDRAKSKFRGAVNDISDHKDDLVETVNSKVKNIKDEALDSLKGVKTNTKSTANDWNNSVQQS